MTQRVWNYVTAGPDGVVNGTQVARGIAPNMAPYAFYLEVADDPMQYLGKYKIVGGMLVPYTPPPPPPPVLTREQKRWAEYPIIGVQIVALWAALREIHPAPFSPVVQDVINQIEAIDAKYP